MIFKQAISSYISYLTCVFLKFFQEIKIIFLLQENIRSIDTAVVYVVIMAFQNGLNVAHFFVESNPMRLLEIAY
jgi:hypothetical protein